MSFLTALFLGNGTLTPKLRADLESEGLVVLEEGLSGSIRYDHFKAPGRRMNGKVSGQRFGLGISKERLAVYCRSGRTKVIDTPFSDPRIGALEVSEEGGDVLWIHIDLDRAEIPKVSGRIRLKIDTPNAGQIVEQLKARLPR